MRTTKPIDIPPPFEPNVITISPCDGCKFFQGLRFFGVPLLCRLYHEGHDWRDTDCEDWIIREGE